MTRIGAYIPSGSGAVSRSHCLEAHVGADAAFSFGIAYVYKS